MKNQQSGYQALIDALKATYDTEKEEKLSTQETQENSQVSALDSVGLASHPDDTDSISPAPPLRGNTQKIPADYCPISVDSLDKPLPPSSILFRFATPFESYVDVFFSTQKLGKSRPKRLAGRKADLIRGGFIRDDGKEIEVLKLPKAEVGAKLIVSVELLAEVESITLEVVGSPLDTAEKVRPSEVSGGRRPSAEMADVAATCLKKDDQEEKVRPSEASGGRRPSAEMADVDQAEKGRPSEASAAPYLKKDVVPELDEDGLSPTVASAQIIPRKHKFPPVNTFVDAGQNLSRHVLN